MNKETYTEWLERKIRDFKSFLAQQEKKKEKYKYDSETYQHCVKNCDDLKELIAMFEKQLAEEQNG